ncbi:hypothetical protein PT974_07997 [Cladobotryum mycophilum]|uniref:Uncharacterized protein n=1 Tax=Cladobotryum mycophilum TaxID=491253 RepID=A0ABR0SC31_9HYPO
MAENNILRTIYRISRDLNEHHFIPAHHLSALEDRLFIACKQPIVDANEPTASPKSDSITKRRNKRAHQMYNQVLDKDWKVFLPFLLAVKPRECSYKIMVQFFAYHQTEQDCAVTSLSLESKELLESIASRNGILHTRQFQHMIQSLSWIGGNKTVLPPLRPSIRKFSQFCNLPVDKLHFLGEPIFSGILGSNERKHEWIKKGTNTNCVSLLVDEHDENDSCLIVKMGFAKSLGLISMLSKLPVSKSYENAEARMNLSRPGKSVIPRPDSLVQILIGARFMLQSYKGCIWPCLSLWGRIEPCNPIEQKVEG